jgi:hypothetical protein
VRNANTPWNARSRATTDWRRPLLERHFAFWHGRCFFTLGWYKEFERATMTRIGRCQIEARHLTGNASSRRDNLAPLKIFQAKLRRSISVCRRRSAVTQQSLIHKLFLKSHSVGRFMNQHGTPRTASPHRVKPAVAAKTTLRLVQRFLRSGVPPKT